MEKPPSGVQESDRWANYPLHALSIILPPSPVGLDPEASLVVKRRFLENLWQAQAVLRTKGGRSVALQSEEKEMESRSSKTNYATAFYNVYQRTAYLGEPKKVCLHFSSTNMH